jgi:hypothetical protein
VIIGPPARELGPFDRFELAVRKFQRVFGPRGAGRETSDRADYSCNRAAHSGLRKRTISLHASNRFEDKDAPVRAPTPPSAAAEQLFLSLQALGIVSPLSCVARNFRLDRAKK